MLPTNESAHVPTQELSKAYARTLDTGKATKKAMADNIHYMKLSVVAHRKFKQAWEVTIILIALYSVLVIPIRIGVSKTLWDPAYDVVDLITWLIYVADVGVNCRTTYIDVFGYEVTDSRKILMKYVGSFRFMLDVLSLVNLPSYMVGGASSGTLVILNILGLLKVGRYFRA